MKIAIATSDRNYIDLHFGHAETLSIYDVDDSGAVIAIEERSGLGSCVCKEDGGNGHDEQQMAVVFASLSDCKYVLVKRIGPHMVRELAAKDVTAFELFGEIAPAIEKIMRYEEKQRTRQLGFAANIE